MEVLHNWLFFSSIGVCFAYVIVVCLVAGNVLESISNSYYLWRLRLPNGKKELAVLLFWGWGIFTALPLMIWWIDLSTALGISEFPSILLIFLACVGLIFTGTAYGHQEEGQMRKVHFFSAAICASLTQVWLFIYCGWVIPALILFVLFFTWAYFHNGVKVLKNLTVVQSKTVIFWMEIASLVSTYAGLFYIARQAHLI